MPRRVTKAQIEQLLASLHAARNDRNKAQKLVDQYEGELAAIPPTVLKEGPYGEWVYGLTEGRQIDDRDEIKRIIAEAGYAMPTRRSKASIVVKPVTK